MRLSVEQIVLLSIGLAYGVVLATPPLAPLVDLPQHMALAELWAHHADPRLAALFEIDLFPNVDILYLLALRGLMLLLPTTAAVKLLLVVYSVGLAASLGAMAASARVCKWSAVLALPLTIHFSLLYGFMSFCLGLPLLLWAIARLCREPATPGAISAGVTTSADASRRGLVIDGLLWLALPLAHFLLAFFGLLAAAIWVLVVRPPARERAARLWPMLPGVLLLGGWCVRLLLREAPAVQSVQYDSPLARLKAVAWALIGAPYERTVEWLVLAILSGVTIALLLRDREPVSTRVRAIRWIALAAAALYLLLPTDLYDPVQRAHGLFVLHPRLLVLAPLLLLPTLRFPSHRGAIALAIGLNLVMLVRWDQGFATTEAQRRGLDEAIAAIPPGKIIKSLIYEPVPRGWRFPSFLHAASLYQARRLGECDQSFALLPFSPVRYRDAQRPYLSHRDEHLQPERFAPEMAGAFDYVLIYDPSGRRGPRGWSSIRTK